MKVLVINAGSSSLKYQLIDMENEKVLAKGLCERIGTAGNISHKTAAGVKVEKDIPFPTHKEAFLALVDLLTNGEGKVIDSMSEISAVGHRVVHGSEIFKTSTLVNDEVIETIASLKDLSPLHNPPQAVAMKACQEVFGKDVPMVAVFDTSFHQTMPEKAYIYGVPYEYYEKYSIRRYGFHGTSHRFVSARMAELLGKPASELKIITCHLGNGSSITAVDGGKSVDTTMGLTPLDGMIMGTRSGGIDPSIVTFLEEKEGLSAAEMSNILNKKSGFLGISGVSSDARDLEDAAAKGNHRARLTLDIAQYQVKKYIGAFAAAMGGVDAVLFTGGIGENSDSFRAGVCSNMEYMGIEFDAEANKKASRSESCFSKPGSKVQLWVVPTDEELLIARDTAALVSGK